MRQSALNEFLAEQGLDPVQEAIYRVDFGLTEATVYGYLRNNHGSLYVSRSGSGHPASYQRRVEYAETFEQRVRRFVVRCVPIRLVRQFP